MLRQIETTTIWDRRIVCSGLNKYLIVWDFKLKPDDSGLYEAVGFEFKGLPNLEDIQSVILKYYNTLCDNEIIQGLNFEGHKVWLTTENQFNYKAAFDFAFQKQILGLPFESPTFKLGSESAPVYKTFEDFEELTIFITTCFNHIQTTLDKYWNIKDTIDWRQYQMD